MITPTWSCSQTESHVLLAIHIPNGRITDAQFEIADRDFAFSCEPHMLHLTFSAPLLEGSGEHALYNRDKQEITVVLAKAQGDVTYNVTTRKPDEEALPKIPKELDGVAPGGGGGLICYGFDERFSGVLPDDGSVVRAIVAPAQRADMCREEEDARFDAAHFWSDQNGGSDEDGSQEALLSMARYVPWYLRGLSGRPYALPPLEGEVRCAAQQNVVVWNGNVDQLVGVAPPLEEDKDGKVEQPGVPVAGDDGAPAGAPYERGRSIAPPPVTPDTTPTPSERELLRGVPSWTIPIQNTQHVRYGLLDVLLATVFEDITTCGDGNTESVWTLCTVSATLSWLRTFRTATEALHSFGRRALCLPLIRSWNLVARTVHHTCMVLALGGPTVIRTLLRAMWLLEHDEHRHLLVSVYIDPYVAYVQGEESGAVLRALAQELHDAFDTLSLRSLGLDVESN